MSDIARPGSASGAAALASHADVDAPDPLTAWLGRTETATDLVAPARVDALAATLDRSDPPAAIGDALPPLWHWMFCVPLVPHADLGDDGHAARGGFLPPVPLPRRMWAGGRFTFHAPLRVGASVRRDSEIVSITRKTGRSGALVFVVVRHRYTVGCDAQPAIVEEHDIVYRPLPAAGTEGAASAVPEPPPGAAQWARTITPDPVLLFRFSALTFNGHRIHYDRRHVTEVEGYPGLVVHGPLMAVLLLDALRVARPDFVVRRFAFRALRPVFDLAPFEVAGRVEADAHTAALWITDADGATAIRASADTRLDSAEPAPR
jgi:3-methylfumaryl-CoA hydratase